MSKTKRDRRDANESKRKKKEANEIQKNKLEMEDGDEIDAMLHQTGGSTV
uniref:SUMO n=1 Tax=Solanum tuberosum TaxID=4113 RepID=M0ZJ22_SOLTU